MSREAFEKEIKADPYKLDNHLIFADWLSEHGHDEEAEIHRRWTLERYLEAENFLVGYAKELRISMEALIHGVESYLLGGEGVGIDFSTPELVYDMDKEFWEHYGVFTDQNYSGRDDVFVSCSC
jgi:uncharacterized protein (TIGR02996 family)